jgi:Competence protein CoiA-like family
VNTAIRPWRRSANGIGTKLSAVQQPAVGRVTGLAYVLAVLRHHRHMPLVADGPGGLFDTTLPDLGVGVSWRSVYRARPRVWLVCPACGGSMHAKVSSRGLRFFAHDVACRECPLTGETIAHRLLKSALAGAVRRAGWHARLEATAPDRRWRADVLASSPDGTRRVAWEAQLADQHDDDLLARTRRYIRDWIEVIWVFDRPARRDVPMVTVEVGEAGIMVTGPIVRLEVTRCETRCVRYQDLRDPPRCVGHGRWQRVSLGLDHFVELVCQGAIMWTSIPRPSPPRPGTKDSAVTFSWTSPIYIRRAEQLHRMQVETDAAVAEERRRRRERAEAELRRKQTEEERHQANRDALQERQTRLTPIVVALVAAEAGHEPWTWALPGDFEHAMGVSVILNGRPVAVICPIASRITDEIADRLLEVTVYVASDRELLRRRPPLSARSAHRRSTGGRGRRRGPRRQPMIDSRQAARGDAVLRGG